RGNGPSADRIIDVRGPDGLIPPFRTRAQILPAVSLPPLDGRVDSRGPERIWPLVCRLSDAASHGSAPRVEPVPTIVGTGVGTEPIGGCHVAGLVPLTWWAARVSIPAPWD